MTYRSLKKFINENTHRHNDKIFDLISQDIKSKILLVLGDGRANTSSFICSIMDACKIEYFHFSDLENENFNKHFVQNGNPISLDLLCDSAEKILEITKRTLSNDDLFLLLSLSFCQGEYAIIEIGEEYYDCIKDNFAPFTLVIATTDGEKSQNFIENANQSTKEIISFAQKGDIEHISSKTNNHGAKITLAFPDKITVSAANFLGTSFYHGNYLYHVNALDLNNLAFALLAIETTSALINAPRPYIYKGLDNANLTHDLKLYSLSPAILLREGKDDFLLHHVLKCKTVYENICSMPSENTVFCGSKEYIEQIKIALKELSKK